MSFAIFKGETSIQDLVSRLFRLPDKSSQATPEQAADMLLKANPQLKDISKVPVGSVIKVPPTAPPLHPAERAPATVSRLAAAAQQAQHSLESLSQRLTQIDAHVADGANAFLALAQSKQAQDLAQKSPELKQELPPLIESAQITVKEMKINQDARNQAMADVRASLQSLATR